MHNAERSLQNAIVSTMRLALSIVYCTLNIAR